MDIMSYLSGYVDGEGSFCVSFSPSKRHLLGWEVRPSFSVSQNYNRAEVLNLLKEYFDYGTIRPDRSDNTLKYEIRSITVLIEKVIPHFEEYPLLSNKQKDFEIFAEICKKIYRKEHLTSKGFEEIVKLAFYMNPSGIRKYSQDFILKSIKLR